MAEHATAQLAAMYYNAHQKEGTISKPVTDFMLSRAFDRKESSVEDLRGKMRALCG